MPNPTIHNVIDRLRAERAVWTLDLLLQDLPGRARRAARRDTRANLLAATAEVGPGEALRRLGPLRRLAAGYLDAEYGDSRWDGDHGNTVRARPRLLKAIFWVFLAEFALLGLWWVGTEAFLAGVTAADPHATGTFHWSGPGIGHDVDYANGTMDALRSSIDVRFMLAYLGTAFVLGGRLWRLLPPWTRRRRRPAPRVP